MSEIATLRHRISAGQANTLFDSLYGIRSGMREKQIARYLRLLDAFAAQFPAQTDAQFFSSPGRTEVGGNHTDHNAGRVLAAAVDLDTLAVAAPNSDGVIRLYSEGYPASMVDLKELAAADGEKYTSISVLRGVCARYQQLGLAIGGFDAYASSNVLKGSGLSSSASFELLVAAILNHFYNADAVDAIRNAQISQYAENNYFGKPCGLMDQTAIAVGGFCTIDFGDFANPVVKKVPFDFAASGFSLVIVDTGGDHADLSDDYAAAASEMKAVAGVLGGKVLREFSKAQVLENAAMLRSRVNDRAILRAIHFYDDDQRVVEEVAALEANDFGRFLNLVIESGSSSWRLLQNCMLVRDFAHQGVTLGLAVSEAILKGRGAWRVHGGGFAGTIQAFVPNDWVDAYMAQLRGIFGPESCHQLMIRPMGATHLEI
jgi:galactokinase